MGLSDVRLVFVISVILTHERKSVLRKALGQVGSFDVVDLVNEGGIGGSVSTSKHS